jgi:hypothetical protein
LPLGGTTEDENVPLAHAQGGTSGGLNQLTSPSPSLCACGKEGSHFHRSPFIPQAHLWLLPSQQLLGRHHDLFRLEPELLLKLFKWSRSPKCFHADDATLQANVSFPSEG